MTSLGNNSEYNPQPDDGDYHLFGATPVFQLAKEFRNSATTVAMLKAELSKFSSEIDQAFEDLSKRLDGAFIAVNYYLWLPRWSSGRLAGALDQISLEGRVESCESAEEPEWTESLLWLEGERASNRQEVLSNLKDKLHRVIEEGIGFFEQIIASGYDKEGDEITLLLGPASEENLAAQLSGEDHGMLRVTGPAGKTQEVQARLSIILYNDVYRRDVSVIDLGDMNIDDIDDLLGGPDSDSTEDL